MSDDIKVYTHLASDPMVKASDHYRIVTQKDAVIAKLREQRNEVILKSELWPTTDAIADFYDAEVAALEPQGEK